MARDNPEYRLYKSIALYLKLQYPHVLYHFDQAGLNLSKAQAGQMKAIQGGRGYPDLFIIESRDIYHGAFFELKPEGTKLLKQNGEYRTPHLKEQSDMLFTLSEGGYYAVFSVGFDETKKEIDEYLKLV